jgi:hypothetical protein
MYGLIISPDSIPDITTGRLGRTSLAGWSVTGKLGVHNRHHVILTMQLLIDNY